MSLKEFLNEEIGKKQKRWQIYFECIISPFTFYGIFKFIKLILYYLFK